jgi:hypothetical protein
MRSIVGWLLCGVLVFILPLCLLNACGDGGGGGSSPAGTSATTSGGSTGLVSVSMTDNDTDYNAVVLTIKEIGIVTSGAETTYYNSIDLGELPLTVNVLDFPDEATIPLGDIEFDLPENGDPVCFNQIRMVLAAEGDSICGGPFCNYVIEKGDSEPYVLKTPSGQQSGVKILTPKDFCVDENADYVDISIDFDPGKAIVHNENNGNGMNKNKYILKPTGMRIIEGEWGTYPEGYINGLVAVPVEKVDDSCLKSERPLVKIAGYYSAAPDADPASLTVALADDIVTETEANDFCAKWCNDDVILETCKPDCMEELLSQCYFTGPYKLLLPTKENYDIEATWSKATAEALNVPYNTTVFLQLKFDE